MSTSRDTAMHIAIVLLLHDEATSYFRTLSPILVRLRTFSLAFVKQDCFSAPLLHDRFPRIPRCTAVIFVGSFKRGAVPCDSREHMLIILILNPAN